MSDEGRGMPAAAAPVDHQSPRRGRRPVHGLKPLRRAVTELTTKRLDGRSAIAVAIRRWKEDVRRDLGCDLTRAQETILEGAAQKLIIRDSLADYIARQPTLANRKRQVAPVVVSFLQVSDSLNRDLDRLGLERKAKPVPSIQDYIKAHAARTAEREPSPPSHGEEPQGEGQ